MRSFYNKNVKTKNIRYNLINDSMDKISNIENILEKDKKNIVKDKKEKGLINRTNESTVVLTEDDKMLLKD